MDQYWKSALLTSLDLLPFVDIVFTPKAFFPYSRKFYPLEFSAVATGLSVGFCVKKDEMHRIDPKLLEAIDSPDQVVYSNDVFVVGCTNPTKSLQWYYFEERRYAEYKLLRESALVGVMGRNTTRYWRIDKGSGEHKVLVVGATNMGNIGDDLIAAAIGGIIRKINTDSSLYFSDFNVSRADLADFDLVIVGGGGIIYSSQFGMNETDNLSNYMKIPLWAKDLSIPCVIMGVSVQGRPGHLSRDPFVSNFLRQSLLSASAITVRDRLSADQLGEITGGQLTVLPDLVFSFATQYPFYKNLYERGCSRGIAFVGELFSTRLAFFNHILNGEAKQFFGIFGATDIRYCIMSNDDLSHKDRFVSLMASKGIECKVHDLRSSSVADVLNCFRGLSGIVTTRFHGLLLSIVAGCPALPIDLSFGKHAQLLSDYFPSIKSNLIDETNQTDQILTKLKALATQPVALLPCIVEIEKVSALTSEYTSVLEGLLKSDGNM